MNKLIATYSQLHFFTTSVNLQRRGTIVRVCVLTGVRQLNGPSNGMLIAFASPSTSMEATIAGWPTRAAHGCEPATSGTEDRCSTHWANPRPRRSKSTAKKGATTSDNDDNDDDNLDDD